MRWTGGAEEGKLAVHTQLEAAERRALGLLGSGPRDLTTVQESLLERNKQALEERGGHIALEAVRPEAIEADTCSHPLLFLVSYKRISDILPNMDNNTRFLNNEKHRASFCAQAEAEDAEATEALGLFDPFQPLSSSS